MVRWLQGTWRTRPGHLAIVAAFAAVSSAPLRADLSIDVAIERSNRLYQLMTLGVPLAPSNPLFNSIVQAMRTGNTLAAAKIIGNPKSGAPEFYNLSIASLAQTINRSGAASGPKNEISALFVGYAKDELKFGEILWADRFYFDPDITGTKAYSTNSAAHFQELWLSQNPRDALKANGRPSFPGVGIFTTQPWGENYYRAGTSRRNWGIGIMNDLFCTRQEQIQSSQIPDSYVARDVPRAPGGDPRQFTNNCRTCHGQMDALRPAFLGYDYNDNQGFVRLSPVKEKVNEINYSSYIPTTDEWHLFISDDQNKVFGFRFDGDSPFQSYTTGVRYAQGAGLEQFGRLLSQANGFYRCMVKRMVSQIYLRKIYSLAILTPDEQALLENENATIDHFATGLQQSQNLRTTYEELSAYYFDAMNQ